MAQNDRWSGTASTAYHPVDPSVWPGTGTAAIDFGGLPLPGPTPTPTPTPIVPPSFAMAARWPMEAGNLWADAVGGTLATDGGPVAAVGDKSGNGRHLTCVNCVRQGDSLYFNGTNAYAYNDSVGAMMTGTGVPVAVIPVFEADTEALGTARTIFSFGRSTATQAAFHLQASGSRWILRKRGNAGGTFSDVVVGAQTVGFPDYFIVNHSGAATGVQKNRFAQAIGVSQSGGALTIDQFTLGALRNNGLSAFAKGKMREVMVVASGLTPAQEREAGAYCREKFWGASHRPRKPARLFIPAGQSNATGRAVASGYAANAPSIVPRTAFEIDYDTTTVGNVPIGNPVGKDARASNTGGAWPAHAARWIEQHPGEVVFYLSVSQGATALQPTTSSAAGNWDVLYRPSGVSEYLADRVTGRGVQAHQKLLASEGYDYPDGGARILWNHGESDAGGSYNNTVNNFNIEGVFSYGGYTAGLIAVRDYWHSALPIVSFDIAELGAHLDFGPADEPDMIGLRKAQADAAAVLPRGLIASDIQKNFGAGVDKAMTDTVHYSMGPVDQSVKGYNGMGRKMAETRGAALASEPAFPAGARISVWKVLDKVASGAPVQFLVQRHNDTTGAASVDWAITGVFTASGTISFVAGERVKLVSPNASGAADATFTISLSNPTGATLTAFASQTARIGVATVTLGPLALDNASATGGQSWTSAIVGRTNGSAITATSDDGTSVTVNGDNVSSTFATGGAKTVTLVETLSGAVNSPRTSSATVTVS